MAVARFWEPQGAMAERAGVSQQVLSRGLRGESLTLHNALKICRALRIAPEILDEGDSGSITLAVWLGRFRAPGDPVQWADLETAGNPAPGPGRAATIQ